MCCPFELMLTNATTTPANFNIKSKPGTIPTSCWFKPCSTPIQLRPSGVYSLVLIRLGVLSISLVGVRVVLVRGSPLSDLSSAFDCISHNSLLGCPQVLLRDLKYPPTKSEVQDPGVHTQKIF